MKTQVLSNINQTKNKTNRQVDTTKVPKINYTRYKVIIIPQQSNII